jgi:hypothetical protein
MVLEVQRRGTIGRRDKVSIGLGPEVPTVRAPMGGPVRRKVRPHDATMVGGRRRPAMANARSVTMASRFRGSVETTPTAPGLAMANVRRVRGRRRIAIVVVFGALTEIACNLAGIGPNVHTTTIADQRDRLATMEPRRFLALVATMIG